MLKYKINVRDKNNELINVQYDSLFYSPDTTYVTGVTSVSYGLANQKYALVEVEGISALQQCAIEATNKIKCGYVIYNQKYDIKEINGLYCIKYIDGLYYCCTSADTKIMVDNMEYNLFDETSVKESIIIPTKYYAYDNVITINEVSYDVNIENIHTLTNNDDYYPYIVLKNTEIEDTERVLYVLDWEYSKRETVTLFKISMKDSVDLHINEAICVYPNSADTNQWDNVIESNFIDLYVSNSFNNNINDMKLFIKSVNEDEIELSSININNEDIFELHGERYKINETKRYFISLPNNAEYELFRYPTQDDGELKYNYYINYNSTPIAFSAANETDETWPEEIRYKDEYVRNKLSNFTDLSGISYSVYDYEYVNINNIDYRINVVENEKKISIKDNITFHLQIYDIIGDNVLRCYGGVHGDMSKLLKRVMEQPNTFSYKLQHSLFNESIIMPLLKTDRDYISSKFNFFTTKSSYVLPIKFERDVATNIHQDFILEKEYYNEKIGEQINRIVDMEKDIYYPARYEKNKQSLTLCHEILIDLHFRSRNLEDWTINEEHSIDNYGNRYPSSWNLFDAYRYRNDVEPSKDLQPVLDLKGDLQYYPPSDLLYFLKFTDDDVFYQKLKLSKSFLRLSFFDSPNPNTQNLLYTTTIFVSESNLFAKYINADKTQSSYVTLRDRGLMKERYVNNINEKIYTVDNQDIVNKISVSTEPLQNVRNKTLSFDEMKRLSCSFSIKNRYEAPESSEGFYLYLFKEYSNGMHERSIYLKVEFNHAGEGKTVNFMQMYRQNGDKKQMINWGSKYSYNNYKDGYTLQELYEHLYIEIKVKYDKENKRFCYYLPEWMSEKNSDKNLMRLSLFEVKIKDESQEP